jgi:hypothetical protein
VSAPLRALLAAGLAAAALRVGAETPTCVASAQVSPGRPFVGQQILYVLSVRARADVSGVEWDEPPAFPALRTESLPAEEVPGAAADLRQERRALFAELPGALEIPAARLACRTGAAREPAQVAPLALQVRPLPEAGRPQGFAGLVGPLSLTRRFEPAELALGESLHLLVRLEGGGNLWDAPDPYPNDAAFGGAEVFRQPPETQLERGRALRVRRLYRYDVVPRAAGRLGIPEIRVAWFDPATGRYTEARAPAAEVAVAPAHLSGPPPSP